MSILAKPEVEAVYTNKLHLLTPPSVAGGAYPARTDQFICTKKLDLHPIQLKGGATENNGAVGETWLSYTGKHRRGESEPIVLFATTQLNSTQSWVGLIFLW